MFSRYVEILGVKIDALTKEQALERIEEYVRSEKSRQPDKSGVGIPIQVSGHHVATVNPEFVMEAQKQGRFKDILNNTALSTADGVGILWAAKYLSLPLSPPLSKGRNKGGSQLGSQKNLSVGRSRSDQLPSLVRRGKAVWQMVYSGASLIFWPPYCKRVIPERVSGSDLVPDILRLAEGKGYKVFLLGGSLRDSTVPQRTAKVIRKKYPNLKSAQADGPIVSHTGDYGSQENNKLINLINSIKPDILLVAFNHPKAQYWIDDNLSKLQSVKVAIGVGGVFEFLSGDIRRAPKVFRALGIEWLWRLLRQPQRLSRILTATVKLIKRVVRFKLSNQ